MIETPHDALTWLKRRSATIRIGKDECTEIAMVIRTLIADRAALNTKVDKLEAEVAALQKKRERVPFEVEGQGNWNLT